MTSDAVSRLSAALTEPTPGSDPLIRRVARTALGAGLVFAGVSHLTFAREEFQAQVPRWFPVGTDVTVLASGAVEITLGTALVTLTRRRAAVGLVAAAFFVAIFPGNIAQWRERKDGFGLDTDDRRLARLFFQPALVAWALWSSGALEALRRRPTT